MAGKKRNAIMIRRKYYKRRLRYVGRQLVVEIGPDTLVYTITGHIMPNDVFVLATAHGFEVHADAAEVLRWLKGEFDAGVPPWVVGTG